MTWPRRIGAIIQVLTGQIKLPYSVPDTCSNLATCALFLLSADLVFDPVAGPMLMDLAEATAQHGTIFEYGALAAAPTPYPLLAALGKGLNIRGYTLFEITGSPEGMSNAKQFVHDGLADGSLQPIVARTFALH